MKVCRNCKHLCPEGVSHQCPSPEYTRARDQLVADAANAVELGLVGEGVDDPPPAKVGPYTLTLEKGERDAIEWIGGRYRHGWELRKLLTTKCEASPRTTWDDDRPITFTIPEWAAWTISEIIEEDHLACFGTALSRKLTDLQQRIV